MFIFVLDSLSNTSTNLNSHYSDNDNDDNENNVNVKEEIDDKGPLRYVSIHAIFFHLNKNTKLNLIAQVLEEKNFFCNVI